MAFADGELDEAELTVLIKLGGFLGVSEQAVRNTCAREAGTFGVDTPEGM